MGWPNTAPPFELETTPETFTIGATPSDLDAALTAALAGNSATMLFTVSAQPAFPVVVGIDWNAAWDGGDVVFTVIDDKGATREITLAADPGNKTFTDVAVREILSARKTAVGASATTSTVLTGQAFGMGVDIPDSNAVIVFVRATANDAWTLDTDAPGVDKTNGTVTPDTDPTGTNQFLFILRATD